MRFILAVLALILTAISACTTFNPPNAINQQSSNEKTQPTITATPLLSSSTNDEKQPTPVPQPATSTPTISVEPTPKAAEEEQPTLDPVTFNIVLIAPNGGVPRISDQDTVFITKMDSNEQAQLIGRDGAYFNALMPGDYVLNVDISGYEKMEQAILISPDSNQFTIHLKFEKFSYSAEDLVVLENVLLNADTGEPLFQGEWLNGIQYMREDDVSFFAQNKWGYWRVQYLDGSSCCQFKFENEEQLFINDMAISRDFKRALFTKDSDIWIADIDWDTSALKNEKQVTAVGLFDTTYEFQSFVTWLPDGNHVTVYDYLVRLDTGAVKSIPPDRNIISPFGSYSLLLYPTKIYDNLAGTEFLPSDGNFLGHVCWQPDESLLYVTTDKLWIVKQNKETSFDLSFEVDGLRGLVACRGHYAVVTPLQRSSDGQVAFVNIETGKHIISPDLLASATIDEDLAVIAIVDERNIDVRGTHLLDLTTGTSKKISNYVVGPSEQIGNFYAFGFPTATAVVLREKNSILFVANEHMWRTDLDGSPAQRVVDSDEPWINEFFTQNMYRVKPLKSQ